MTNILHLLLLSALALASGVSSALETPPPVTRAGTSTSRGLPSPFVPNLGQWEHDAEYVAQIGDTTVFLEEDGWTVTLVERRAPDTEEELDGGSAHGSEPVFGRGVAVRMTFADATAAELVPRRRLSGVHNYFLGDDPARWRSEVPLYGAVRYSGIRPGVDVLAREQDGYFEYDLLLAPDARVGEIEIVVEGIERLDVDADGTLVLETELGPVRMAPPPSWEEGPLGEEVPIDCRYVLLGANRFGFDTPPRRPDWALVVDPGLVWSTFVGGALGGDLVAAVAVDDQGAVTFAGRSWSTDYPTTPGAFDPTHNGGVGDAFVSRLSPTGASLVYSTFVGGTDEDGFEALVVDPQGAATVAGWTDSPDYPTTPGAFDTTFNGSGFTPRDVVVSRISPTGSSLVYSSFLGGTRSERPTAMAVDVQGAATVTGWVNSDDFPTTPGAFDTTHNGGSDVFVARLSPTGSNLVFSTFLGGSDSDLPQAVALDAQDAVTVAGRAWSSDFPTTAGAFDTTYNGGLTDGFVARLSPTGASLVYSTFLGGSDPGTESVYALALGAQGEAIVAGSTGSVDYPTTPGAFSRNHNGGADAFLTAVSPSGASLVFSTFLGGSSSDVVLALALNAQDEVVVAGYSFSADFPTTPGAYDRTYAADRDVIIARLSPTGSSLQYSTFVGGCASDFARGIALDQQGDAVVAGWTSSLDFPTTTGVFDTTFNGPYPDTFVARFVLEAYLGTSYCGPAVPASHGQSAIILACGSPVVSDDDLTLVAVLLPPDQFGYFLASQSQAFFMAPGSQGFVCLGPPIARFNGQVQSSGASGSFQIAVDLTQVPLSPPVAVATGETWNFQCWFRDGATSNFTDGVSVTFQ